MHYSDAVKNGREQPDPAKDSLVDHSEIMFGEQEVRLTDLAGEEEAKLTKEVMHHVGFDT